MSGALHFPHAPDPDLATMRGTDLPARALQVALARGADSDVLAMLGYLPYDRPLVTGNGKRDGRRIVTPAVWET